MFAHGALAAFAAALALAPGATAQQTNVQHVSIVATQTAVSKAGYETFQIGVNFEAGTVLDVYALFGQAGATMVIPPAFQVPAPFGADVGPVRVPLSAMTAAMKHPHNATRCRRRAAHIFHVAGPVHAGQPGLLPDDARR